MDKMFRGFVGEVKDANDDDRSLVALVSTNTRDRMDEVLDPSGIELANYRKNPIVLFAHNMHQPPIGKALWIKESVEGIIAKVQFAKTQLAEDIYQLYKQKFMNAFSVGFIPKESKDGDGIKEPRRTITKWELLEFSAVPVPANPDALLLALKTVKSDLLKQELKAEQWGQDIEEAIIKANEKKYAKKGEIMPSGIDDIKALTDELEALKLQHENEVAALQKEIADLKYTVYCVTATLKHQPDTMSEITDETILQTIEDSIAGVVRQVTGKVS